MNVLIIWGCTENSARGHFDQGTIIHHHTLFSPLGDGWSRPRDGSFGYHHFYAYSENYSCSCINCRATLVLNLYMVLNYELINSAFTLVYVSLFTPVIFVRKPTRIFQLLCPTLCHWEREKVGKALIGKEVKKTQTLRRTNPKIGWGSFI